MGKKLTNWSEYNESLVRRGKLTLWFSDEILTRWSPENRGLKSGRPFVYCDEAIETLLIVRGNRYVSIKTTPSAID